MIEFMRAGGYAMWIILALGLACLALTGSFVWRPAERKLAMIRPLSLATVFAVLSGVTSGLAMTTRFVAARPELAGSPEMPVVVLIGIGESLTNAILGFSILMLVWILVAIGLRRQT
jgi:hypothetical protein